MNFHKNGATEKGERWWSTVKDGGPDKCSWGGNLRQQQVRYSWKSFIPLQLQYYLVPLFHVSHQEAREASGLQGQGRVRGWGLMPCPTPTRRLEPPDDGNPQSPAWWGIVHTQGKGVLLLNYHSRLERENRSSKLVKLRPRGISLASSCTYTSHWGAQNLRQVATGEGGCLNPVAGWPVTTHHAA